jgi:hypothetical protein
MTFNRMYPVELPTGCARRRQAREVGLWKPVVVVVVSFDGFGFRQLGEMPTGLDTFRVSRRSRCRPTFVAVDKEAVHLVVLGVHQDYPAVTAKKINGVRTGDENRWRIHCVLKACGFHHSQFPCRISHAPHSLCMGNFDTENKGQSNAEWVNEEAVRLPARYIFRMPEAASVEEADREVAGGVAAGPMRTMRVEVAVSPAPSLRPG